MGEGAEKAFAAECAEGAERAFAAECAEDTELGPGERTTEC